MTMRRLRTQEVLSNSPHNKRRMSRIGNTTAPVVRAEALHHETSDEQCSKHSIHQVRANDRSPVNGQRRPQMMGSRQPVGLC
jgi:hypothetical protein